MSTAPTPNPRPTTDKLIDTWLLVARHDLSAPFPSRGALIDLVTAAFELERQRIEHSLCVLYYRECPALFRPAAEKWIRKVEAIIANKEEPHA